MSVSGLSRRSFLAASATTALPLIGSAQALGATTSTWSQQKKYREIDGVRMAYYEAGQGDPIVFLHGNPTSSYLWRKVIPHVQHLGRCIAPDMVGMGDSAKLPNSGPGVYTFINHRNYLYKLLEELRVEKNVLFVIHDWGSAMGFNWAYKNPDRVKGIAYMESLVRPPGRDTSDTEPSPFFKRLRSEKGEKLVLEDNLFITMFLREVGLYLTEEDEAEYRRPYLEPGESRRPTLTWPREVPIGDDPAVNARIIDEYSAWLAETEIPKLLIKSDPGIIFRVKPILKFVGSLKNQKKVTVFGGHFVQEVSGDAIGRALAEWIPKL